MRQSLFLFYFFNKGGLNKWEKFWRSFLMENFTKVILKDHTLVLTFNNIQIQVNRTWFFRSIGNILSFGVPFESNSTIQFLSKPFLSGHVT